MENFNPLKLDPVWDSDPLDCLDVHIDDSEHDIKEHLRDRCGVEIDTFSLSE